MSLIKLKALYKNVSTEKLIRICSQSSKLEQEANKLSSESNNIDTCLVETIKEKFPNFEDHGFMSEECESQISKMSKQWRLIAASMVTVKRSIQLNGFHTANHMNLYANPRYGIKELRRCSGWSPFVCNRAVIDTAKEYPRFIIEANILHINQDQLRFGVLDAIPQLDQDKVDNFKRITQEIVWMIDSWRNFYNILDVDKVNTIKNIIGMSTYISDRQEFNNVLNQLDMLVTFNKTLSAKVEAQVAKWEPTIVKWQEVNKNFLVLNELSKTELKV